MINMYHTMIAEFVLAAAVCAAFPTVTGMLMNSFEAFRDDGSKH